MNLDLTEKIESLNAEKTRIERILSRQMEIKKRRPEYEFDIKNHPLNLMHALAFYENEIQKLQKLQNSISNNYN